MIHVRDWHNQQAFSNCLGLTLSITCQLIIEGIMYSCSNWNTLVPKLIFRWPLILSWLLTFFKSFPRPVREISLNSPPFCSYCYSCHLFTIIFYNAYFCPIHLSVDNFQSISFPCSLLIGRFCALKLTYRIHLLHTWHLISISWSEKFISIPNQSRMRLVPALVTFFQLNLHSTN